MRDHYPRPIGRNQGVPQVTPGFQASKPWTRSLTGSHSPHPFPAQARLVNDGLAKQNPKTAALHTSVASPQLRFGSRACVGSDASGRSDFGADETFLGVAKPRAGSPSHRGLGAGSARPAGVRVERGSAARSCRRWSVLGSYFASTVPFESAAWGTDRSDESTSGSSAN